MNTVKRRRVAIVAVLVVILGVSWFGLRRYNCQQRNAAFGRQIETIRQDAPAQIKRGTKKSEVALFFAEHSIPVSFVGSEAFGTPAAIGTLTTSGCAPFGCGSDVAVVNVRVKLDEAGAATEEPTVGGIYTNCL
jgi:hypothetical protein